jgi:biotin transport system substrate-specific component
MIQQQVLNQSNARDTILPVIAGSLFIALCAQIKIPLWFTPIPLTLQTLAVMIMGATLGARSGAMSVLLYLAQISMGFPYCSGGISNPFILIGPSGGYLYGMILQAYMVGWLFERRNLLSAGKLLFSVLSVCLIQLGLGTIWLAAFVGFKNAPMMGFLPFVPGEIIKVIAATSICEKLRKV